MLAAAHLVGALIGAHLFAGGATAQVPADFDLPLKVCSSIQAAGVPSLLRASDNAITFTTAPDYQRLQNLSITGLRNIWTIEPGGRIASVPNRYSASGEIGVLTETPDAFVARFFDDNSGIARGTLRFEKTTFAAARMLPDSLLLADRSGVLRRISLPAGKVIWNTRLDELNLDQSVIGDGQIAVATGQDFAVVDLVSGETNTTLSGSVVGRILGFVGSDTLLAAGSNGEILAFDAGDGKQRWRYKTGGKATSAVSTGESVLVGSTDNFIYRINLQRGSVEWKTRLTDRVLNPPVIAGEVFSIANELRNTVEVHDLSDGRIINRIEVADGRRIVALVPGAVSGTIIIVTAGSILEVASNCGQ